MTVLTIAVIVLTVVLSMGFAQTQQTDRVVVAASQRQNATDATSVAALTRSQAEGAILIVAAATAGLADPQQSQDAISALYETIEVYRISANPYLVGKDRIAEVLGDVTVALEAGDTATARQLVDESLDQRLRAVSTRAAEERLLAEEVIALESSSAGRWGLITSFGVAVIVPAVALITFRALVTRRRKQQDLEDRLEKEQEISAAKDEVISNLSHELRTPLTGIYGLALAMEETGFENRAFQAEMTNLIIHEAADLSRMVDDLLTAAKVDGDGLSFQIESVDVAREVHEALTPFRRGDDPIAVDIDPAVVHVDRLRLRQVLRNLVSNAVRHGGPSVAILGTSRGDRYIFEVVDDGPGVPDHVAERLFERFVHEGETPLLTGSIGLGLSIAQLIATEMNSNVAYHRRDEMTVFELDVPLAEGVGQTYEAISTRSLQEPRPPSWDRGPSPATNGHQSSAPPALADRVD